MNFHPSSNRCERQADRRRYPLHVVAVLITTLTLAHRADAADPVDYQRDVLPIFEKYCIGCHADDDDQGGLAMDSFSRLLAGGDGGAVITPGVPASSRLVMMSSGTLEPKMPPDDAEGPNESELALISAWVEQGAIGPSGEMPSKQSIRTPKIPTVDGVARPITAIATTVNGKLIATATYGKIEILIAGLASAPPLRTIATETGKINSLRFSRDGSRLLVGSGETGAQGTAAIYSIETAEKLSQFVGHRDSIFVAEFSPDEKTIATAGYDRDIVLWNIADGKPLRTLQGHNGAINDLVFSPAGSVLVSASSDATVKVWNVATGQRLDTMSQSEAEVLSVDVTSDGRYIVAAGGDNRLRVYSLLSTGKPAINPVVATRFVDESAIMGLAISPDKRAIIAVSESGNVQVLSTEDWQQVTALEPIADTPSDVCVRTTKEGGAEILIALMNGTFETRTLPQWESAMIKTPSQQVKPIHLDFGPPTTLEETKLREADTDHSKLLRVPRHVEVTGAIEHAGEVDRYQFAARQGEVWAIDADVIDGSQLDPLVKIVDGQSEPVLRTRLQAVRDSYFTFRGKDSMQSNDFRLFSWQEMNLNDYVYANGEVTRLWMYPRGPDSGFNVYPGRGQRWTYFDTNHVTHALGEPAYVVRPLAPDSQPATNGLPIFDVYYENDDDPAHVAGKNSRLLFTAPVDADYTVCVTDTRGDGNNDVDKANYAYRLKIRAAVPSFTANVNAISKPIHQGSGRECTITVDRIDGFDGDVVMDLDTLPDGLHSTFPVTLEAGQRETEAMIWADADCLDWQNELAPQVTATATILGRHVERVAGMVGKLKWAASPQATAKLVPTNQDTAASSENEPWTLSIRRGETVSARVIMNRHADFDNEISFGKEFAGRSTTHGVYVDNIGLNGLLLLAGETERGFFITADPISKLGKRLFYLEANVNGGITSPPIWIEVLP